MIPRPRYRFGEFTLSPRRRLLLRSGRDAPLIPRYFDLLVLLVERRNEVVSRREIFDRVWADVVVADGSLTQAIRILRKVLGDHPRQPRFIRTASRHGYQFVFPDAIEEPDESPLAGCERTAQTRMPPAPAAGGPLDSTANLGGGPDPFEAAIRILQDNPGSNADDDEARSAAAETLHLLGTAEALRRLEDRPGSATVRAWLRDTRWGVPGAGAVPILGKPEALGTIRAIVVLRLRRAARFVRSRWASAAAGGAAAGCAAGLLGGALLRTLSGPEAPWSLPLVFAVVAVAVGGIGAAGVGAGLAAAEALSRSRRTPALVLLGSLGGGAAGAAAHLFGAITLEGVFGHDLSAVGGGLEGLGIGAGAGLGYALGTLQPRGGGMAAPRGWRRARAVLTTGALCAAAAVGLAASGGRLGGTSLDFLAQSFTGSRVGLAPLARRLGEMAPGPRTRTATAAFEGLCFGSGLAIGLTRRPRRREP